MRPSTVCADGGDPSVLCVYSSKGGVGKTTVATNLAARMADHLGLHVLVMDLDLSFGDVGSRMHKYSPTVIDALSDPGLSVATFKRWLHQDTSSGFWALLAPTRPDAAADRRLLSPTAFRRLLAAAANFDVIVLDCPVELSDPLVHRFALRAATAICFVVSNERATLVDAARALEKATRPRDDPGYPGYGIAAAKFGLLINQHIEQAGMEVEGIRRMMPSFPIVATIPDQRLAHVAAANGAEHLALSGRAELVYPLDMAISALLPRIAPLPSAPWSGGSDQLARLQADLQRQRWSSARRWFDRVRSVRAHA
ncbi:MAG: AAA family ATPase [Acidimicrobiales bacterium]